MIIFWKSEYEQELVKQLFLHFVTLSTNLSTCFSVRTYTTLLHLWCFAPSTLLVGMVPVAWKSSGGKSKLIARNTWASLKQIIKVSNKKVFAFALEMTRSKAPIQRGVINPTYKQQTYVFALRILTPLLHWSSTLFSLVFTSSTVMSGQVKPAGSISNRS